MICDNCPDFWDTVEGFGCSDTCERYHKLVHQVNNSGICPICGEQF